jgi:hypothetical protein
MEVFRGAACLIVESVVLSAQWAGERRLLCLQRAAASEGELAQLRAELVVRDENQRLNAENALLKGCLGGRARKQRYLAMQRLEILWHMAHYGIARKRLKEHFCIARSTLYRWLRAAEKGVLGQERPCQESSRKTPAQLARLIWDIFNANPHFGRNRIAMTMWTLGGIRCRLHCAQHPAEAQARKSSTAGGGRAQAGAEATRDHRPLLEPCVVRGSHPGLAVADLAHLDSGGCGSLLQNGDHSLPSGRTKRRMGCECAG